MFFGSRKSGFVDKDRSPTARRLPFPDELDDGAMGEDDIWFVLEGIEVMFGEGVTFFGGDEESAGLLDECAGGGRGEGFFFIKGLVHGDNEFGERMEPGEPWVAHEEFEKMVGGLDRADGLLVAYTVVINEGLVEAHEAVTDFREVPGISGGGTGVR